MVTMIILDGFGISKEEKGNAILAQSTPYLDKLKEMYPHTTLQASGEFVGLTPNQIGNSEVGHLNLGAGRVVYQDLPRINNAIKSGDFAKNKKLEECFNHAKKNYSNLHIMGLVSDGGVHSHIDHLKELVKVAQKSGIKNVYVHCFLDGRDTPVTSGKKFVEDLITSTNAQVKSLIGRVYAMDREKRYDRIEVAYDMLALGKANAYYENVMQAFEDSYKSSITDEFFKPTIIGRPATIESGDSVIFFNFRTDRARELTEAFTQKDFDKFERKKLENLHFLCMTEYDEKFDNVSIMFPPEKIEDNLGAILSQNGKKQFRISETTKYAHVTYFFNGGIENPYPNEDRELIESINDIDFSKHPNMRAFDITTHTADAISKDEYDFILVNLSNPDMIGHTGNFEATKEAIKCVDKCAYMIALSTLMAGGQAIITADHGNAEQMLLENNQPCTSHTTNPVPFILVSEKHSDIELMKNGKLANVAPTILKLLNIEIPKNMEKPLF